MADTKIKKIMQKKKRLEERLWDAADQLRANSGLKASEYAQPVLGSMFILVVFYNILMIAYE